MNELERFTNVREKFNIGGIDIRVIGIDKRKFVDRSRCERLGNELLGYLAFYGENAPLSDIRIYDPRFSDSSSDCVVDFSKVEYLSSVLFGKLITFDKWHRERRNERGLSMFGIAPCIYEVFAITRLNRLFHIYGSVEDYTAEMRRITGVETIPAI